jgi:hypothetical protein
VPAPIGFGVFSLALGLCAVLPEHPGPIEASIGVGGQTFGTAIVGAGARRGPRQPVTWRPDAMPKLLRLTPVIALLAVSAPQSHLYAVARYGARCDAVTSGPVHTTLVSAASRGSLSIRLASVANVVRGAQLYLDPASSAREVHTVSRVTGDGVTFGEPLGADRAAGTAVYGSGGYVAGSDDTKAINAAFAAAARDPDATVLFPTGSCAISGPLDADTSGLTVAGAGMHSTMIVAMPSFDYDPARTPRGLDGQYVGMLWTDLPEAPPSGRRESPPQPPLQHVTIRDLGLDPRAGTQRPFYKYNAISGDVRAMQYFTIRNVYFELGAPFSFTDIVKPFTGINYIALSYDPDNSSHDILIENVEGHNGVGTTQLRQVAGSQGCRPVMHDKISSIKIVGEKDVVDLNDIEDDRIVITASACHPGAEMDDVEVSNHVVTVAPSVTTGGANGFKVEALNATIHGVRYAGVQYTGSPNGSYIPAGDRLGTGTPFAALIFNKDSGINDIVVTHLHAVNSQGMGVALRGGPSGEPVNVTLDDVSLLNSYGRVCIRFGALAAPTGNDRVHISNVTCAAAPEARAQFGAGVAGLYFLPSGLPTNGVSGDVVVQNAHFTGFAVPLFIYGGGGFAHVVVDGATWDTGKPAVDRTTIFRNSPM